MTEIVPIINDSNLPFELYFIPGYCTDLAADVSLSSSRAIEQILILLAVEFRASLDAHD